VLCKPTSISVDSGAQTQTGAVFVSSCSDSDLEEEVFFLLKGVVDLALHIVVLWMEIAVSNDYLKTWCLY
jgi:hypothetical protein